MNRKAGCLALLALVLSFTAGARDIDQDEALELRESGKILPLEQLVGLALGRYPGSRLLEVELEQDDALLLYEVELLTVEGEVRELELDARDGTILKDEVD
jgi:uncharacterized membrane protein YkoI